MKSAFVNILGRYGSRFNLKYHYDPSRIELILLLYNDRSSFIDSCCSDALEGKGRP